MPGVAVERGFKIAVRNIELPGAGLTYAKHQAGNRGAGFEIVEFLHNFPLNGERFHAFRRHREMRDLVFSLYDPQPENLARDVCHGFEIVCLERAVDGSAPGGLIGYDDFLPVIAVEFGRHIGKRRIVENKNAAAPRKLIGQLGLGFFRQG